MIAVIQRVLSASVNIKNIPDSKISINKGYLVLIGIKKNDSDSEMDFIIKKILNMRIFENEKNKMDLSIKEISGEILLIPQFTLLGNIAKGLRPDFMEAEKPDLAKIKFDEIYEKMKKEYERIKKVFFGEHMIVNIENDGPVTIIVQSEK